MSDTVTGTNRLDFDRLSLVRLGAKQWPRRLLYVTNMCSYARGDGNMYGTVKEPSYGALSYT